MQWLELVLLGTIQGLTEFLPISSDGHLALAQRWLGISQGGLAITVALHAGTLLAVLVYFRQDLRRLTRALPDMVAGRAPAADRRLTLAIVAGSIPTAVIGLALKRPTEELTTNLWAIGGFLLLSGAWNWVTVRRTAGGGGRGMDGLGLVDAIAIGAVQGLAVLPGLSRSASTIGMGVGLRLSRDTAARYSFLLSLPAVAGALLLEAKDFRDFPADQVGPVLLGAAVSFTVGMAALAALFRMLRAGRFDLFAFYCWALAAGVFLAAWRA